MQEEDVAFADGEEEADGRGTSVMSEEDVVSRA